MGSSSKMCVERKTWNVVQLGVGMMMVFFAFLSQAFIVETVLENRNKEDPSISKNAGYYSQTVVYGAFILGNLVAPPIVSFLGLRWSFVIGSGAYVIYMAGFLFINSYYLYASAAFEGFCAGLLWTSVGHYLALNSNEQTISRHSSLLWTIYMLSVIFGGVFLLIVFGEKSGRDVSMGTTRVIYGCFAGVALVGVVILGLLPQSHRGQRSKNRHHAQELVKSLKLLTTLDLWLLAVPFAFSGVELSFWSGVYPTSLSFTQSFTINTNQLMAFNSICIGIGELSGAVLFGVLGRFAEKYGRYWIMWLGTLVSLITYALVWINLPGSASYEKTSSISFIQPSVPLGLICGAMLGFTDCCINTQIYAFVALRYPGHTSQAFALHKFFHSALTTVCMFYGSVFSLPVQLIILAIGSIFSSSTFTICEKRFARDKPRIPTIVIDAC